MKSVSEIVWEFISSIGTDKVFYVSGGGCIFLLDALGRNNEIQSIPMHHEQSAAIAAEGWSRETEKVGVCLVTSGPGGTNALTGTLCSYLDSIPVIYISGNVNREMTTNWQETKDEWDSQLRQFGDQEFNIVKTVSNMTKWAVQLNDPYDVIYTLQRAYKEATSGRPGPVWIDIPLNIQSHKFNEDELFDLKRYTEYENYEFDISEKNIDFIVDKINNSEKPLIIAGNGIRLASAVDSFRKFVSSINIPVVSAVNGNDVVNHDYQYYFGRFGTHAQISANKIIQEADLILTIGSRLYVRQTGYNFKKFGKNAYHIHIDIDETELNKSSIREVTHKKICADAKSVIEKLSRKNIRNTKVEWLNQCNDILNQSPTVLQRHRDKKDYISNYFFIERLNDILPIDYDVVTSDGSANVVTMQVLKLRGNQRLFTNTGAAPMGYGLPAAIGASFSGKKILCIEGDGSIHLNIQELQTISHYTLPMKVVVINNGGYLSIKISQKTFMDGRYFGINKSSGLSFPEYRKISDAYGIKYFRLDSHNDIDGVLKDFFDTNEPSILEVFTDPNEYHEPKVVAKLDDDGRFIPGELQNIEWLVK